MTEPRVSDEQIAEMVAEVEQEDVRAKAAGEAHGNYGETYGAVLFDLRDSRTEVATLKAQREDHRMRADRAEEQLAAARSMDMFRAGVEAAALAAEQFFESSDQPADISANECGQMISVHAIRPLCTQPMPGATVGGELRGLRAAREQAEASVAALRYNVGMAVASLRNGGGVGHEIARLDAALADSATLVAERDARLRREALEEAARLCDERALRYATHRDSLGENDRDRPTCDAEIAVCGFLAAAIRALLPPSPAESPE